MYVCFDDVTLDLIPADASVILAYIDGPYANVEEARARFPHAHILTISTGSGVAADGYDIERYDYIPDDVDHLYAVAKAAGVWRPFFYVSLDNGMADVQAKLADGIPRSEYRLWAADYTYEPHIPNGMDACQWTDKALGRSLDESLLLHSFIREPVRPPVREPHFKLVFDRAGWHIQEIDPGQ